MGIDKKKARPIREMANMVAINSSHPSRTSLFDIYYQLQKILGNDNHTLAFQCAVDGVVYGVTLIREQGKVTCRLLAFIDNHQSEILWPSVEHILHGIYAISDLRPGFDFKAFSTEIATLFEAPMPITRRRLASVLGPEAAESEDLETRIREAVELAEEFGNEGQAEPFNVSLGVSFPVPSITPAPTPVSNQSLPGRRKSVIFVPEALPTAVAGVRARVHSVFLGKKEAKKTIMLDACAIRVTEALLGKREEFTKRDPRQPLRRAWPQQVEHVLYINHTAQGLWVYAGPAGFQHKNRIFIPFQLDGSYVKIPPNAPWQLIADMLGV